MHAQFLLCRINKIKEHRERRDEKAQVYIDITKFTFLMCSMNSALSPSYFVLAGPFSFVLA